MNTFFAEMEQQRACEMAFFQGCPRWNFTPRGFLLEDGEGMLWYPAKTITSEYNLNKRFFRAHTRRILVVRAAYLTKGQPYPSGIYPDTPMISAISLAYLWKMNFSRPVGQTGRPRRPGCVSGMYQS